MPPLRDVDGGSLLSESDSLVDAQLLLLEELPPLLLEALPPLR